MKSIRRAVLQELENFEIHQRLRFGVFIFYAYVVGSQYEQPGIGLAASQDDVNDMQRPLARSAWSKRERRKCCRNVLRFI